MKVGNNDMLMETTCGACSTPDACAVCPQKGRKLRRRPVRDERPGRAPGPDGTFHPGDRFTFSQLYGGNVTAVIVSRTKDTVSWTESWVAEDTGELVADRNIQTSPIEMLEGKEAAAVWEYRGETGYIVAK